MKNRIYGRNCKNCKHENKKVIEKPCYICFPIKIQVMSKFEEKL